MGSLTLDAVNRMSADEFVACFGGVFEHSQWVARSAFGARPFANVAMLQEAMTQAVRNATPAEQLALLNAHPELAGREAQSGALTQHSTAEQASAGLHALSAREMEELRRFNREYREKFGFPFIIAVRAHRKEDIFRELERRLANDLASERRAALEQVFVITRLRLDALIVK